MRQGALPMPTDDVTLNDIVRLLEASKEQVEATPERIQAMHAEAAATPIEQRDELLVARRVEMTRAINDPWMRALELMSAVDDAAAIERDGRVRALMEAVWSLNDGASIEGDIWRDPEQQGAKRGTPPIPSAFANRRGSIPSSLAVQGVLASLHAAQDAERGWRNGEASMPVFDFARPQGTARVLMRPNGEGHVGQVVAEMLWSQVRAFSDKDGDVLLAMMAQAMEPGRMETDGATWITAAAILDYRGVRPIMKREGKALRRAGHRVEDMAEIAACVDRLGSQWIELIAVQTRESRPGRRQPKVTRTSYESKLFVVDEHLMQGDLDGPQRAIAWRYRLGRCITEFLSAPNRQVARIMQHVLEYDPYRQSFEKRLGRYFTIHHRISASYKAPLRRKVGGLFDELRLPVNRRNPSETRTRFEAAMDRLVADDVLPGWRYPPESAARIEALPARHWLADWRACVVEVPAPHAALEAPGDA